MSEKMQVDADREAKLIINDANQKADAIVRESRDSLKRIYQEITELKKVRMQFESNMKALIQSHLAMIDQGQKIMPNPEAEVNQEQLIQSRVSQAIQKKMARTFRGGPRPVC